jgi:4-aminobutyrate aminotransferase/(S)-3-amino-2-methylpropionate transaminase
LSEISLIAANQVRDVEQLIFQNPRGADVGRAEIMDAVHAWGLGGTYGGNLVACAAGLAVMEVFEEENMLEKSVALGEKLMV